MVADRASEPAVLVEAHPAGRGPVPADRMALRIRQQSGGGELLRDVELAERVVREADLGHAEAAEVRGDLRQAGEHLRAHRLEDGVRGRRQHAEENAFAHGALWFVSGALARYSRC